MSLEEGIGNCYTMRGTVVEDCGEDGWVANMAHPALSGIELPRDALHLTRSYPNPGARTRITRLAVPDLPVSVGDQVTAVVATTTEESESEVIMRRDRWGLLHAFPKVEITGGTVVKWGPAAPQE